MADDADDPVDIESIFPWMNDPVEEEDSTMETLAKAAVGLPFGLGGLAGALVGDDDDDDTTAETIAKAAVGLPVVVADALFDDEEQSAEGEPSETENGLFSLIDKTSEALDDLGSRLKGAVDDFAAGDADGDKLTNSDEFRIGTNPWEPDTDGDGDADGTEHYGGTNPLEKDTDGDGPSDFQERIDKTDPLDPDDYDPESPVVVPTIFDAYDSLTGAVVDAVGLVAGFPDSDPDRDGLTVAKELAIGTNPLVQDTDGDGLGDGKEHHWTGTDPLKFDTDGDQLSDRLEDRIGSDPMNPDSDGDGELDGLEHIAGTLFQPNDVDDDEPGETGGSSGGPTAKGGFWKRVKDGRSGGAADDSGVDVPAELADDGSGETGQPFLTATEVAGDLAEVVIDGVLAAPSVAKRLLEDARSEITDGPVADIVMGLTNAEPGRIEQEQLEGRGTVAQPVPGEPVESSTPATEDEASVASNEEVEVAALPQILEVSDPVEVEVPVEAVAVEQPQVEIPEPEPIPDRFEDIDESVNSLTDFDDPTD